MKDSDWKIIVTLYDCKNVTRAANMLYMSQPTLSKSINRIEEELGEKIIERSNKGIVFTESGEYLALQALEISKLISDTMQHYQELKQGGQVISIGCASSFARYSLPNLMRKYNEENQTDKKLRYNVQVMNSSEIINLVQRQELKIGFINGDRNWDSRILCSVGYGCIISKNPVNMEDLPNIPLICHHRDAYSLNILSTWWKNNFKTPFHITYMVSDITTSLRWIEEGLGYGIMYSNTVAPEEDERFYKIPMIDQKGNPIRRDTWMIYHPNRKNDPTIKKFIRFVSSLKINDVEK